MRAFPPARLEAKPGEIATYCAGLEPSWLVRIMPFLEAKAQFAPWDLYRSFSDHDEAIRSGVVATYLCPSRRGPTSVETLTYDVEPAPCGCGGYRKQLGGALGDYTAAHGDPGPTMDGGPDSFQWGGNGTGIVTSSRAQCENWRPVNWTDRISVRQIKDGMSYTLIAGEKHVVQSELGRYPFDPPVYDGDVLQGFSRIGGPGYPIASGPNDSATDFLSFGSWHAGVCNFVFADVSVQGISPAMDTEILGNLCNRDDGQVVSRDDF